MAGASDVRAGRAYIELGTEESKLVAGLKRAMAKVRSWGEEATALGSRISLFGVGGIAGLTAIARGFSEAGVQAAKLRAQTGLSADAVAGLVQAAENSEVAIGALVPAVTKLQVAMNKGGTGVVAAFDRLGISLDAARSGGLAATIGMIADRLPQLADETERVAIANLLFGRSGYQLLPVLEAGSQGLADAAVQARLLGTALDEGALDAAGALDDSFDALGSSITGVRNAIGETVASALTPYVDALAVAIAAGAEWIKQNSGIIELVLHSTVAIAALGASILAAAAAALVIINPLTYVGGLLVTIGTAALAVTDALGVTDTGFKDLWNSIRVGGQGLGTWFAKFWLYIERGWDIATDAVGNAVATMFGEFKILFSYIYKLILEIPKAFVRVMQTVVGALNFVLEKLDLDTIGTATLDNWEQAIEAKQEDQDTQVAVRKAALNQLDFVRKQAASERDARFRKDMDTLNAADPNDASSGISFDRSGALAALNKIGAGITGAVTGALSGIDLGQSVRAQLEGLRASDFTSQSALAGLSAGPSIARQAAQRPSSDVLSTFSAAAANRLGFGSTLEERQTKASEETAKSVKRLVSIVESGEGLLYQ